MSTLAGLREGWRSTPRPRHIGRQAEQGCLASTADRGPGKSPQRCKAPRRLCGGSRIRVDRSQRACRTCPKGPENGLGWAAAPTQVHQAQLRHQRGAAEKEAGSPTHREVPVGEGPPVRQRRDRVCQQQPEGARSLRVASRHQTSAAEGQRVGAVLQQREDPLDLGLHEPGRVQGRQGRPSGNCLIICSKSND